jgi:membrane-associated phospholipid phosphatase
MEILDWGVQFILTLQKSAFAPLTALMRLISFLGQEEFYLLFAPAVYWCMDAALGLRLGLFLMTSASLNTALKFVFHAPRPYWYDPYVLALAEETSFGIPSGHAQNGAVFWGVIAAALRRRRAWIAAALIAFFIGLSRLYLGVHFPTDVLAGWLIGAALLWWLSGMVKPALWMIRSLPLLAQIGYPFAVSLFLIVLPVFIRMFLAGWQLPPEWSANAAAAFPASEPIHPLEISGVISNAAAFFGMAAGALLLTRSGGFNAGGALHLRLARYLLGLAGVVILWYGLGEIFPRGEALLPYALRYLRYALVGLWVTWGAPLLFRRLRLA